MLARALKALGLRLRFARNQSGAQLERLRQLVNQADLFDPQWYLERYPDVARAALDPLDHFILHGGAEGRSPGPRFDARWYLRRNADVARSGTNPLIHYLEHGRHEGRSIKALHQGGNEDTEVALPSKSKKASAKVAKAPFPNEYDTRWQAEPVRWTDFADKRSQYETSAPIETLDATSLGERASGSDRVRIARFMATIPGLPATGEVDWEDLDPAALGLGVLEDGWFAHARQLLLRVGSVPDASRVIAFQVNAAGSICAVADETASGTAGLVRLNLQNPFSPVLLSWLAPDGQVIRTALSIFPSLYRGGIHHAELQAVGLVCPEIDGAASYMAELAAGLFGPEPLLLGKIGVDLQGANGSEQIFQPAVVASLLFFFGVELVANGTPTGSGLVADRLVTTSTNPRLLARRGGGANLLLPADCVPSLAALCLCTGNKRIGAASFCIVPASNPAEAVLACLPSPTAAMRELAHPALPLPQSHWTSGDRAGPPEQQAGLPSAIRSMNSTVWQVDPLMPLSPDVDSPSGNGMMATAQRNLRVVVTHSGTAAQLDLCLLAVEMQSGVRITGISVLSEQPELVVPDTITLPVEINSKADGDPASESVSEEQLIVLIDTAIFPHDPRTFAAIAGLCATEGIGAASCAVVTSTIEEGAEEVAQVAWVPDCTANPMQSAARLIARFFPAATFTVPAFDPRIAAVRADIWQSLPSELRAPGQFDDMTSALANACKNAELLTVTTTVVRAAIGKADASLTDSAPEIVAAFVSSETRASATHLIRLMP